MSTTLLILIILYFFAPAVAGAFSHLKTTRCYETVKTYTKIRIGKLWGYRNYFRAANLIEKTLQLYKYLKKTDALERTSLIFLAACATLFIVTGLSKAGVTISRPIGQLIIALLTLTPVVFILFKFDLLPKLTTYYKHIKWVIGAIAIIISFLLGIFADYAITSYTHTRAENFPAAQKALTTIFTLLFWCGVVVAIGIAAYLVQAMNLVRFIIYDMIASTKRWKIFIYKLTPEIDLKPYPLKKKEFHIKHEMILFLGLLCLTSLPLKMFLSYLQSNTMDTDLQHIIVTTSLLSEVEDCGFPKDDRVAIVILPMGKMVAATRLSDGSYVFEPGDCKPVRFEPRKKVDISIYNASIGSVISPVSTTTIHFDHSSEHD